MHRWKSLWCKHLWLEKSIHVRVFFQSSLLHVLRHPDTQTHDVADLIICFSIFPLCCPVNFTLQTDGRAFRGTFERLLCTDLSVWSVIPNFWFCQELKPLSLTLSFLCSSIMLSGSLDFTQHRILNFLCPPFMWFQTTGKEQDTHTHTHTQTHTHTYLQKARQIERE